MQHTQFRWGGVLRPKLDGGLTFAGPKFFCVCGGRGRGRGEGFKPILGRLLHSGCSEKEMFYKFWNKFSPETKLCLLKTGGSYSAIFIFLVCVLDLQGLRVVIHRSKTWTSFQINKGQHHRNILAC